MLLLGHKFSMQSFSIVEATKVNIPVFALQTLLTKEIRGILIRVYSLIIIIYFSWVYNIDTVEVKLYK